MRGALVTIEHAERSLQGTGAVLRGKVRLSVSTTYGHYRLPPKLAAFALAFPEVSVEVSITNRNVDLVAEGYDLAIRLGPCPIAGLLRGKLRTRRFASWRRRTTSNATARPGTLPISRTTPACPS